ncbi:MAG: Ig-like domain-containing protein, partial [Isosphaeraceae bacterium]
DAARFVIDPATGALSFVSAPDFEFPTDADGDNLYEVVVQVSDGLGGLDTQTLHVAVTNLNEDPVAAPDDFFGLEDTSLSGDVLANDSDVDGDPLTASLVSGPAHGTLAFNADGSFTYSPDPNWHGLDSFTYRVGDGRGGSAFATVRVHVGEVNDTPVAVDDDFTLDEDRTVVGDVLANDSDVDGDPLTVTVLNGPTHGTLNLNPDGTFLYTPDEDWWGVDRFTYQASDGALTSWATVTLTVRPVNDAPVARNDAFVIDEDTALDGDVLTNDFDVDGDTLMAELVRGPSSGVLTLLPNGGFRFVPVKDWSGDLSFAYRAVDRVGERSAPVTVTIQVRPVVDLPVAVGQSFEVTSGRSHTVNLLSDAWDADGDPLSVSIVNWPRHGVLLPSPSGSYLYRPNPWFQGQDGFSFVLTDGYGFSEVVEVPITVLATEAAPAEIAASPTARPSSPPLLSDRTPNPSPEWGGDGLTQQPSEDLGEVLALTPGMTKRPAQDSGSSDATATTYGGGDDSFAPSPGNSARGGLTATGDPGASAEPSTTVESATPAPQVAPARPQTPSPRPPDGLVLALADLSGEIEEVESPGVLDVIDKLGEKITLNSQAFLRDLDAMSEQISRTPEAMAVTVAVGSGMVASVGYVVWTTRGSLLLTSLVAATPLWRQFDPLAVLENHRALRRPFWWRWRRDGDHDSESLQSLLRRNRRAKRNRRIAR